MPNHVVHSESSFRFSLENQSLEIDGFPGHDTQECLDRFRGLEFDPCPRILDFEWPVDQKVEGRQRSASAALDQTPSDGIGTFSGG
jgi:hypothetical protein